MPLGKKGREGGDKNSVDEPKTELKGPSLQGHVAGQARKPRQKARGGKEGYNRTPGGKCYRPRREGAERDL